VVATTRAARASASTDAGARMTVAPPGMAPLEPARPAFALASEWTSVPGEKNDLVFVDPVLVQESGEGAGDCAGVAAVLGEVLG
jgi:hypothetical protein